MNRLEHIIIGLFVIIWIVLSFFFFHDLRPTGLTTFYSSPSSGSETLSDILPKKSFTFEFESKENNLGIVELRLRSFKRIENYAAVFRIREKGQEEWYSERIYYMIPLEQNSLYPFGFPPIGSSKGVTYEIELRSIGNKDAPVAVSSLYPSVVLRYQTPLSVIKSGGLSSIKSFTIAKIANTVSNTHFLFNILFFLCPLGFLLAYFVRRNYFTAIILGFAINIIVFFTFGYINLVSDLRLFYVSLLFLTLIFWRRISPSFVFLFCLVQFLLIVIALGFGKILLAERSVVFLYAVTAMASMGALFFRKSGPVIPNVTKGKTAYARFLNKSFLSISGAIIIFAIVSIISLTSIFPVIQKYFFPKISENASVSWIAPTVVYNGSFVVLKGKGFGNTYDHSIRLMSTYGEIEESEWTDTGITFRIPLDWESGTVVIWFSRSDHPGEMIPPEGFVIEIVNKNTDWSEKDNDHYTQINISEKQVREVNGFIKSWYQ